MIEIIPNSIHISVEQTQEYDDTMMDFSQPMDVIFLSPNRLPLSEKADTAENKPTSIVQNPFLLKDGADSEPLDDNKSFRQCSTLIGDEIRETQTMQSESLVLQDASLLQKK